MLEDARGKGESRLEGLTGIVIKDVEGKPFSEYGRYLVNAGQVMWWCRVHVGGRDMQSVCIFRAD